MLVAGIGFVLLRMWGLYVFLFSVTINWITFYVVYDGASRNYPLYLGFIGPVVICIGQNHVVKGLDQAIEGKEPGKHTIELSAENAFGKKDA